MVGVYERYFAEHGRTACLIWVAAEYILLSRIRYRNARQRRGVLTRLWPLSVVPRQGSLFTYSLLCERNAGKR